MAEQKQPLQHNLQKLHGYRDPSNSAEKPIPRWSEEPPLVSYCIVACGKSHYQPRKDEKLKKKHMVAHERQEEKVEEDKGH